MRTPLDVLNDIRIASPCHESWEAMAGTDRVRHCDSCRESVYDISAMTAVEAVELIKGQRGRMCVRLYKRADGKVLTRDCPEGRAAKLKLRMRRAVLVAASWLGLAPAGCRDEESTATMGTPPAGVSGSDTHNALGERVKQGEMIMGGCRPPPFMGEIAPLVPQPELGPMPREVK